MRTPPALRTLAALSALGCAPVTEPAAPATCEAYRERPAIHAYCVRRSISALDVDVARARCDALGAPYADDCRHAWVLDALGRPTPPPRDVLLDTCGVDADCAFEVVDRVPAADVGTQLADCRAHAGRYTEDCVHHALQGWRLSYPDAAGVAAVADAAAAWPMALGVAVGNLRWCEGVRLPAEGGAAAVDAPAGLEAGCPTEPVAASACLRALQDAASRPVPCSGNQHSLPTLAPPTSDVAPNPHTFRTNP